jgi:uncharacterized membrane protein
MEGTRKRSIVKSIAWRIICIVVSIITTFIFTGEWNLAVAVGTIYNAITMVLYYFHERIWNRIKWGCRETDKNPDRKFNK